MRSRKKLSNKQKQIRKFAFAIFIILVTIVVFFEFTVRDRLESVIIAEIKKISNTTINDTVNEYIKENEHLISELVTVSVDSNEQIRSVYENVYNVNTFKTDVSKSTQTNIEEVMSKDGLEVKLGNFTGLVIFAEMGPYIHVNIDSTPTISCELQSSFESAGVNQTVHHISLLVHADIYVGNPFRIESIKIDTDYEISQTVIVGEVPSAYGTISRY